MKGEVHAPFFLIAIRPKRRAREVGLAISANIATDAPAIRPAIEGAISDDASGFRIGNQARAAIRMRAVDFHAPGNESTGPRSPKMIDVFQNTHTRA
jgi:hypothetical protein